MKLLIRSLKLALGATALTAGLFGATMAMAQQAPQIAGKVEWGIWVDDDGCMHWWADGGLEGYMLDRVNPKTGKPVCLKKNTCLVENTDTLFATDSSQLTATGRRRHPDAHASIAPIDHHDHTLHASTRFNQACACAHHLHR